LKKVYFEPTTDQKLKGRGGKKIMPQKMSKELLGKRMPSYSALDHVAIKHN